MKYHYKGTSEVLLADHHLVVKPGDVIEVDAEINNPTFEPVTEKSDKEAS